MERSSVLKALAFNCSLKSTSSGETSSTEVLLSQLISQLHPPEKVALASAMAASAAVHLAKLLKANPYPGSAK
jgi:hypothetical protein